MLKPKEPIKNLTLKLFGDIEDLSSLRNKSLLPNQCLRLRSGNTFTRSRFKRYKRNSIPKRLSPIKLLETMRNSNEIRFKKKQVLMNSAASYINCSQRF